MVATTRCPSRDQNSGYCCLISEVEQIGARRALWLLQMNLLVDASARDALLPNLTLARVLPNKRLAPKPSKSFRVSTVQARAGSQCKISSASIQ